LADDDRTPPFPDQPQPQPGFTERMEPRPDHGEESYKGSGRLESKKAVITGGDSGIGRAVAIAYAREGADVFISYLSEHEDAEDTKRWVEKAGRKCVLFPGDIADADHCRALVAKAAEELGRIDILVNNAAHQDTFSEIEEIEDAEWDYTFRTNIHAMFYITKAAIAHMGKGGSIINTTSIQADSPSEELLATPRPRARSRISPAAWRRCWRAAASEPIASRRGRSGRPSFPRRCQARRSRISASRCRWSGPVSRPSSLRFM
jgi:hypothetical protein